MKYISWNVNGIRAVIKKGFFDFIEGHQPDILCLQETKAHPDQVDQILDEYPYHYWNSAERRGYSGTAVFSKVQPLSVREDLHFNGLDDSKMADSFGNPNNEGRVIALEFEKYYLVNVYTPNSKRGLERLSYRHDTWDKTFLRYVKELEKTKPVIFCGDLNVAHKEIDLARPKDNRRSAGFTDEERNGFDNIVKSGFIDTFREFNTEGGNYTWWSYMGGARARNVGWRIDYFCISPTLSKNLKNAFILPEIMGSDHCPIGIEIAGK